MAETDDADEPAAPELAAGTDVGGYLIDKKIGQGGMGEVYGAHHPRIGKRVAIKVLAPQYSNNANAVSRFEQEARLVNEVRHPNIVDVFQFGELPDKRNYFVMEWLEGESLTDLIERAPLSSKDTIEILDAVCDALEAAHEHNVVHRDLKSDNVFLVTKRGKRTVKLLDFGLAKLAGKNDLSSISRTRSGVLVGTPAYMAPEQARGKSVDARTDIYALGVLAYKCLTGTLPFKSDNAMDLIVQHLNAPRPSPAKLAPKTPPELARLVVRMMSKNPDERPTLAEVRKLFASLGGTQSRADTPVPTRKAKSVLIGMIMFLAGVIAIGGLWLYQREKAQTEPAASASEGSAPSEGSAAPAPVPPEPTAVPTPPVAEPAVTPPAPEIEMPADPVAAKGSAAKPKRPKKTEELEEEEVTPEPPPANRPGALLLSIHTASQIDIDGVTVAASSRGGRFEVKPGKHEVRVKAPGREPVSRSFEVEPGGAAVMHIADDVGE